MDEKDGTVLDLKMLLYRQRGHEKTEAGEGKRD